MLMEAGGCSAKPPASPGTAPGKSRQQSSPSTALAAVAGHPDDGLTSLNALPAARLASHLPFWAVRGHLLALLGKPGAAETYRHSAGLSHDPAVREWLLARVRP